MGIINKCKICYKSGLFMKTLDGMCNNCFSNLNSLKIKRTDLLKKIQNCYPSIEDNIRELKDTLKQLSDYTDKNTNLDFDSKSELEDLLIKEDALILAYKINKNVCAINEKGVSSYEIETSLNILKEELLPLFIEFDSKNIKFSNWTTLDLEDFIKKSEQKLLRRKKKEDKDYKDKQEYVAFDIETTGLSPETSEILEIAAVKVHNGKIIDTFQSLVKPEKKITKKITSINGITNEMVENENIIEEVLPKFIDFIEKYPLIAHNAEFDYSFICANYKRIYNKDFKRKTVCTMKLYRKEYKDWWDEKPESAKLQSCVEDLLSKEDIIEHSKSAHRALNDAIMVYKIYEKLKYGYM